MTRKVNLVLFLILVFILNDATAQDFFSPPLSYSNNDLQFTHNSPFDHVRKKRKSRRNKNKLGRIPKDIAFTKGSLFFQGSYGMSDYAAGLDTVSNGSINKFGPFTLGAEYAVYHNIGIEFSYAGLSSDAVSSFTYQTFDNQFNIITQQLDIEMYSALSAFSLSSNFHILARSQFFFIPASVMKRLDFNYGFGATYFVESSRTSYHSQYLDDVSASDRYWGINMKLSVKYFITKRLGICYESRGLLKGYFKELTKSHNFGIVYKLNL